MNIVVRRHYDVVLYENFALDRRPSFDAYNTPHGVIVSCANRLWPEGRHVVDGEREWKAETRRGHSDDDRAGVVERLGDVLSRYTHDHSAAVARDHPTVGARRLGDHAF